MSKTGGGKGTNQYGVKGVSKRVPRPAPNPDAHVGFRSAPRVKAGTDPFADADRPRSLTDRAADRVVAAEDRASARRAGRSLRRHVGVPGRHLSDVALHRREQVRGDVHWSGEAAVDDPRLPEGTKVRFAFVEPDGQRSALNRMLTGQSVRGFPRAERVHLVFPTAEGVRNVHVNRGYEQGVDAVQRYG